MDASGFFVTACLGGAGNSFLVVGATVAGDDFFAFGADLGELTDGADADDLGNGATGGTATGGAVLCGRDCGKSADGKSEERLGRAELGTTDGAVVVTLGTGKSGIGGTDEGDGDELGLASK